MSEILNMIANNGFPIVMCLILMWYIKDNGEKHKEEVDGFVTAIQNNTNAITRLMDKLDVEKEDDKEV